MDLTAEQLATLNGIIQSLRDFLTSLAPKLPAPEGNYAIAAPASNPSVDPLGPELLSGFTPNANAPMLAWCDDIATAGRDITFGGGRFTDKTELHVCGESASGKTDVPVKCTLKTRNGNRAVWQLPKTLPANAFVLAWPYDPEFGYGMPIAVNPPFVKTCNGDYTGASSGRVGDTVYTCGTNLDGAMIYLHSPATGLGYWVTPTSTRFIEAVWQVPSIPLDTYELWVHNKRGGKYGWQKSRLTFKVWTAGSLGGWDFDKSPTVPISKYTMKYGGGPGDGKSMRPAWNATIAEFNGVGGTIVLDAGEYLVDGELLAIAGWATPIRIVGAGKGKTIIRPMPTYTHDKTYGIFRSSSKPVEVHGITFDFSEGIGNAPGLIVGARRMVDCAVLSKGFPNTRCAGASVAIGCDFIGGMNTGAMVSIDGLAINCTFRLANYVDLAITNFWGFRNGLVRGCVAEDYGTQPGERGYARLVGTGFYAAGFSVIDCVTKNLAVDPSDTNRGEQILVDDNGGVRNVYNATGGTTTTVRVSIVGQAAPSFSVGSNPRIISVVGGAGVGQYAQIVSTAIEGMEAVFTLDRVWRIPATTGSRLYLSNGACDILVAKNKLAGNRQNAGASCGMHIFAAGFGVHFIDNDVSGTHYGICIAGGRGWGGMANSPAFRFVVADCTFDNVRMVARFWHRESLDAGQEVSIVSTFTNIVATNIPGGAIGDPRYVWLETTTGLEVTCQNVTISGAAKVGFGGYYTQPRGNILLHDCRISTTTTTGSTAIKGPLTITADPQPAASQFVGFAS